MQHGPLNNFHLFLNHGIALAKYSTRDEASKVCKLRIRLFLRRYGEGGVWCSDFVQVGRSYRFLFFF